MNKSLRRCDRRSWRKPLSRVAAALALLHLAFAREANAYLDPGSVSLFVQAVLAGVLGGLLLLKRYWQKIKAGLRDIFSSPTENEPD